MPLPTTFSDKDLVAHRDGYRQCRSCGGTDRGTGMVMHTMIVGEPWEFGCLGNFLRSQEAANRAPVITIYTAKSSAPLG